MESQAWLRRARADIEAAPVRTGACSAAALDDRRRRTSRGQQAESLADCGAAGARINMTEIYASLDRYNLPGRIARMLPWIKERDARQAQLDWVEGGELQRTGPSRTMRQDHGKLEG